MGISHKIPCQTHYLPAEFLCNLPKNLTMHLTHKFCLVLPLLFFIDYGIINARQYRTKSVWRLCTPSAC
ncbi:MAG TPA: hypothetical protein DHU76_07230, partial [Ruminococcus sp.]|nr:hypothetical protein [Ruminococcus sp.]